MFEQITTLYKIVIRSPHVEKNAKLGQYCLTKDSQIFKNYPAKSRGISPGTALSAKFG